MPYATTALLPIPNWYHVILPIAYNMTLVGMDLHGLHLPSFSVYYQQSSLPLSQCKTLKG